LRATSCPPTAATVNTTFESLLASCALQRIEPWAYLRDLFCLLPGWPQRRVLELAPAYWAQTCPSLPMIVRQWGSDSLL